jgi:RNA polymerase sigma-70 factor (ECF subfamily)|tara:strand:- start:235 stop:777 length:543 start_codon:yes stop_codon:yes gene_type:complete
LQNEAKLITQLKSKNSKELAFQTLVKRYKERLYWHIRKIVLSHDDADDILQNTFIKIFRNIDKFKGESKLFTWMYRIATNESITFLNSKAKRNQVSNQDLKDNNLKNLVADVYFDGDEIQFKLQKAIAQLPRIQQLVFNMRYFDDIKYKDMSAILETSEGALKASYHIAVKKIKTYLLAN